MAKKSKNTKISKSISNKVEKSLSYLTNPRIKEIIERRFGLRDGQFETLESIGQSHGITRERVRQIQSSGLKILKSDKVLSLFDPIYKQINDLFKEHGHIVGEEHLYKEVTGIDEPHPRRGELYLLLTLGDPYERIVNDPKFHTHWQAHPKARTEAEKVAKTLISHFEKQGNPYKEQEVLNVLSKKHSGLPRKLFFVVLDISKHVDKNAFGEVGLSHWPEVSPQGIKDKAYLVLKKEGKPLHFREITDLINKTGISKRPAYVQTVHNELIKDPRFVLTGRGTYALIDWGYQPGTVEEVIEKILQENKKPLTKEEIIERVLEQRQVQPTTIILNLQRSPKAQKLDDGRYTLA
ncbi:MAG: hypothetical protein GF387_03380 [Candidatus Portnoybacteria bacterium]|nr:hypothetical protein [Candidatus Portnoybacteria bacterium]